MKIANRNIDRAFVVAMENTHFETIALHNDLFEILQTSFSEWVRATEWMNECM